MPEKPKNGLLPPRQEPTFERSKTIPLRCLQCNTLLAKKTGDVLEVKLLDIFVIVDKFQRVTVTCRGCKRPQNISP